MRDYLEVLRRRWALVASMVLLGLGAAAAATFTQEPQYGATTRLFVSAGGADEGVTQAYQGTLFVQQRVKSYLGVVDSPSVLQPVREELDLDAPVSQLKDSIGANSPLDTVLIDITASSTDPEQAVDLANAVAEQFAQYVEELESRSQQEQTPVKVTVVEPASLPASPISPNTRINLALGLLAGVALGVGAAALRESLDTTVHDTEEIESITKAPVLGDIPYDPSTTKEPLLPTASRSLRAEAFRGLRTNLQYVDVDNPVRVVVVTSALPAEGKTHTAANLAIALAKPGQRVLLLEGDLRRPRAVDLFGLVEGAGLTNVLVGATSAEDVIQAVPKFGIDLLPSGPVPPNPSELLSSHQMESLLNHLKQLYDIVVVDAPPLLAVTDAAVLARAADGAVVVVKRSRTKREELDAATESLEAVNARVLGAIINMTTGGRATPYSYLEAQRSTGRRRATWTKSKKRRGTETQEEARTSEPATGTR